MFINLSDGRTINIIEEFNKKSDKLNQIKNKLKEDIEDGNFIRHGIKKGGKGGDTYYKISAKEYAQEILQELD